MVCGHNEFASPTQNYRSFHRFLLILIANRILQMRIEAISWMFSVSWPDWNGAHQSTAVMSCNANGSSLLTPQAWSIAMLVLGPRTFITYFVILMERQAQYGVLAGWWIAHPIASAATHSIYRIISLFAKEHIPQSGGCRLCCLHLERKWINEILKWRTAHWACEFISLFPSIFAWPILPHGHGRTNFHSVRALTFCTFHMNPKLFSDSLFEIHLICGFGWEAINIRHNATVQYCVSCTHGSRERK